MSTASLSFVLFVAAAAFLYHLTGSRALRQGVMLAASLAFLASFSTLPSTWVPLAEFLLLGYACVHISHRRRSTAILTALVLTLLLVFCWLKKYWFLSFLGFLPSPYVSLGLSYIFFRVMALVVDIQQDATLARIGPLAYVNFTLNFPTLVAGPIQRYQDFEAADIPLTLPVTGAALRRITIGFFKVVALSSLLSLAQSASARQLIAGGWQWDQPGPMLGAIALYPLYLYCNFSGYTDIVIGAGMLLGKRYPENFNRPFSSLNFIDFWSRWHMTLSNWLRDYVYSPFLKYLMQRVPQKSLDPYLGSIAFFVTFFLIGIWHGSTVIFAVYGVMLALGVSINKLYQVLLTKKMGRKEYKALASQPAYQAVCRGLTYTWYAACMVCFWASGEEALKIVHALGMPGIACGFLCIFAISTVFLSLTEAVRTAALPLGAALQPVYAQTVCAAVLAFLCIATVMLTQKAAPGIIYQAF